MTRLKKLEFLLLDSNKSDKGYKTLPFINCFSLSCLKSIETLKIYAIDEASEDDFLSCLKDLINLKYLDISVKVGFLFGKDLLFLLEFHFKKLEYLGYPNDDMVNKLEVQKKYPKIKFRWYYEKEAFYESAELEFLPLDYYEGEYDVDNNRSGKGKYFYTDGDRYEGEWLNDEWKGGNLFL
jgi:hypothetical protein